MAVQNTPPRTHVRDSNGPRAVDSGNTSSRHRGSGRRPSKGDEGDKHRPKRRDSHNKGSKKDSHSHRRRVSSASNTQPAPARVEQPTLELTVIGQPARGIQLGTPVTTSVVVSLRHPPSSSTTPNLSPDRIDTSRLFAVTSLVSAPLNNQSPTPLEAGTLTGQKTYDSVHEMPPDSVRTFERIHPHLVVLGYFSFPGLLIRQAGTFRVRTTLARMGAEGAVSLCMVDSEAVKVERRGGGGGSVGGSAQRRGGRMYA